MSAGRERALLAALAVLPLLPFLGKAFSIDAPVFLAVAEQILRDPLDPYGFEMVWDPTAPEAHLFNRNPPLLSYYLAPWIAAAGAREWVLHAALLPFPLCAALAFAGIARRLAGDALRPAALLVVTPVFLVLATTLLLDVPLLAMWLLAVWALLRSAEGGGLGFAVGAGLAAAAAGLVKYVGLCAAPLLAAGALLLHPRPGRALAATLLPPLAIWTGWSLFTAWVYGTPHLLGSTDVVTDRAREVFDPNDFWNQVVSVPIYYGAGLLFPVFLWARVLVRAGHRAEWAVAGVLGGLGVVTFVLPEGQPLRRVPLGWDEAVLAATGFAGALHLWVAALATRRVLRDPVDAFLALWAGGLLVFSMLLNWHVNAADALLAAPPVLLLLWRREELRPGPREAGVWIAAMLGFSLLLAAADAVQANSYREAARRIGAEIGDRGGDRFAVGQWGLQHYLEEEGFRQVLPPHYGRSRLERGDLVASARNVSQMDVFQNMKPYRMRRIWSWEETTWLPLRTTNADAGAGFYSHHSGYAPFAFDTGPVEQFGLAEVVEVQGSATAPRREKPPSGLENPAPDA